ncbi:NAD(P)-dependent oxidoreductase [Cohnella sp. 56]|uniref:NAD(P)-dependent oxidoreductase n=1 Tax=Cohnella sp. 56 TaxID=3113722 RepID=UPI0030E7A170
MNIGIIGASGKAGQAIALEAAGRGHQVTALVRNADKVAGQGWAVLEKDAFSLKAEDLSEFDVVVNAFAAPLGEEQLHVEAGRVLIAALQEAPDTRLIVVGGAGSLYVDEAKTVLLVDSPDFPEMFKGTASNQAQNLEELKASGIRWTFVSPSAFFDPAGKRTGAYRQGKDNLLVNSKGNSYISYADYAIAIVDEIEQRAHEGERFTVVGEAE